MSFGFELPQPQVIGEVPIKLLRGVNVALAVDGFTSYRGGSYSPHHPGYALKMHERFVGQIGAPEARDADYDTARPLFEAITGIMDAHAQVSLNGLMAVAQKARIHGADEEPRTGAWARHASNVTYWDREDYFYGPSHKLVVSDYEALDVLSGQANMPRFKHWLTSTHEILDMSDQELTKGLGLSITTIQPGELTIVPAHSVARRQGKNRPDSTYIELGYDKPIKKSSRREQLRQLLTRPSRQTLGELVEGAVAEATHKSPRD